MLELPTLGTNEFTIANNTVTLYPNPTKGSFTLTSTLKELEIIGVYDVNGRELTSSVVITKVNTRSFNIDLTNLSQGLYIIKTKTQSYKVIK